MSAGAGCGSEASGRDCLSLCTTALVSMCLCVEERFSYLGVSGSVHNSVPVERRSGNGDGWLQRSRLEKINASRQNTLPPRVQRHWVTHREMSTAASLVCFLQWVGVDL